MFLPRSSTFLCRGVLLPCLVASVLFCLSGDALATTSNLLKYGEYIAGTLETAVKTFRTIMFFVLILGVMWLIAMWATGRPAIKPVVTVIVAVVMLGGIQVILNTFVNVSKDTGLKNSPTDMLQGAAP